MRVQSCLVLPLVLGALLGVPAGAAEANETTVTADLGVFSITYPAEWNAVTTTHDGHRQIGLFADAPFDVSIVAASRPLDPAEVALEPRELLDRLVLLTVDNQGALGNQVVTAGRVDPLVADWPAFSVVATDRERRKMITCWRWVVEDRLYTLTAMTDNSQASPELGAVVRRVVESLRVNR